MNIHAKAETAALIIRNCIDSLNDEVKLAQTVEEALSLRELIAPLTVDLAVVENAALLTADALCGRTFEDAEQ